MLALPYVAAALAVSLAADPCAAQEYRLEGSRVVRSSGARSETLSCTLEGGTGEVRALARAPGGNVWVAGEHGLFVGHDELEHLDPVPLWQGAPRGAPVGVVLEDEHRLWLATEGEFGCVDLRQFFGRTFTSSDGLPPPPYRSLRRGATGELVLEADGATFRYWPGRDGAPECRVVSLSGLPFVAGERVALPSDEIELEVVISGGAELRWRALSHPNWNLVEGSPPAISGLEPGRHDLALVAFDRDLATSAPVDLSVAVPYPAVLSARRLVTLAGLVALLVLAAFAVPAWRRRTDRRGWLEALGSAALVLVFGAQVLAAIFPHARGWPFVGFDMYTQTAGPFSHTYVDAVYGLSASGERRAICPWNAAFGPFELRGLVAPAVHGGAAERAAVLEELEQLPGIGELAGFEVVVERFRLTERGPIRVAPLRLCRHAPEVSDGAR